MQTFAVITGVIAAISLMVNILQWMHRIQEKKSLSSNAIDNYCSFHQIATFCDDARIRFDGETDPPPVAQYVIRLVDSVRGVADAARFSVKSYAQVHLGFTPKFQHPADEGQYQVDKYHWLIKHGWFRDTYRENRRDQIEEGAQ